MDDFTVEKIEFSTRIKPGGINIKQIKPTNVYKSGLEIERCYEIERMLYTVLQN